MSLSFGGGYITELQPADVLFGRGSGPNDHEGNIWFRQLVAERKPEYMATNHRMTKAKIAREIVDAVLSKNGRFLRKLEAVDAKQAGIPDGIDAWIRVDDDTIMEKAKQALRQNTSKTNNKPTTVTGVGGGVGVSLSAAVSVPSSSNSINSNQSSLQSHHNNNNNMLLLSTTSVAARQIPASLSDDEYDDFEPLPITSSAAVNVHLNSFNSNANSTNSINSIIMNSDNNINNNNNSVLLEQQTRNDDVLLDPISLGGNNRGGGGYYSVVSPQTTSLEALAVSQQQQQQQPIATGLASGLISSGATVATYGGIAASAAAAAAQEQNQFLSHHHPSQLASGPPPIVPWGSNSGAGGGGVDEDYTTTTQLQHEPVMSAPNVRPQQQQAHQHQHHYSHQSQHQQHQNRYQQHNQSVARIPQQNEHQQHHEQQHQQQQQNQHQQHHHPHCNTRESLTLKDVFRSSDASGNRRGSMDMSELMDSFRAAKLGPGETSKKLMASTETMGTIEQYNTGSYAEMSMATMNSSTFSFMKGDDSMAQLESSHIYDYQHQQHRHSLTATTPSSSNVGSSMNSSTLATLAGRSILVPGGGGGGGSSSGLGGVGGRPNLSSSHTGSSNSTLHTTDSSGNYKFAQRDSVCSNKSTQSDTSISISDFIPRRKSAGVGIGIVSGSSAGGGSNYLSGVREDAEGFGQEETQFSTADLDDVDPLPMSEQQMSSATVEGLSNSSLSMLKGMLLSTDDMGAFQDEQQQQQQFSSNRQDT